MVGKDGGKKRWGISFSSARNGAGIGTSQSWPSSVISLSCQGQESLEFSDHRNSGAFPKVLGIGQSWNGMGRRICGVGKACVDVLHMEHRNLVAQEAPVSPDVAEIKKNFCCSFWAEHSSGLNVHMDDV